MSLPISSGDIVAGRYAVGPVIGSGGAGIVFAAEHLILKKRVVLKFLRNEPASDADMVRRFVREARATAQLRSEHVARVMDAEIIEPTLAFIAMEYLEGRDLSKVVEQDGPLPVEDAVGLMLQACEGIAEAHGRGIIHRDIKPSNLFLTRAADGTQQMKVLDFGLSKIVWSNVSLTSENCVIGSPHFMSPEQMRSSRDADARSDIWALGAVLFTLLAGVCPFPGQFLTEVCAAVLSGSSVDLRSIRPQVPEALEAVILRCLSINPQDRFQTVPDLAAALQPFAPSSGSELVARIRRIAEAAEAAPQSEAPLSLANHPMAEPPIDAPKPGASVSAAVLITPAPRTNPRAFIRGAVVGAVTIGLVALGAQLWKAETKDTPVTTAHASASQVSVPDVNVRAQASPNTAPMEPHDLAAFASSASPASAPVAVATATVTTASTSRAKQPLSHAVNQSPSPRRTPVATRRAGSPSDEDLILSLPH